jgi:lipopolysaccharide/colanic/teichoic acid biosynthesis glycosyltransferase/glycosyltransferase involved in cell wall biosynthesis
MFPDFLLETLFFLSVAAIVYHHVGYPVLLHRLAEARRRSAPVARLELPSRDRLPSIAVIVPAHNEAGVIAAKIKNLAALDYPPHLLTIIIALDGCTDRTKEIAVAAIARFAGQVDVRIVEYRSNIGKVAVLNDQIAMAWQDIVALSDASSIIESDSLLKAASHLVDSSIGVVCGTYRLTEAGSEGERAYWQYQTRIKADEAALAARMGAHGAFYLFRRALWSPLPADTINDDFVLPMQIVARGYRAVYERSIVATELERTAAAQEFRRRVRIGAGNMQQTLRLARLADPRQTGLAFVFLSGKGLRPIIPFLIILAIIATIWLAIYRGKLYRLTLILEVLTLILASAAAMNKGAVRPKPLAWLAYLVEGHAASLLGAVRFFVGLERAPWRPAAAKKSGRVETGSFASPVVAINKRLFDIIFALLGLLVLALFFVPIALAIRLDSPGPILYRQVRVGRSTPKATYIFRLIKFRTMKVDAEAVTGPVWASKRDPRVTRVGRFLRKTRLDELPQCINVLKGEMAVIGPRPERPRFFNKLEEAIPFYAERTYGLRPGITGLAQVYHNYDESLDDVRTKLIYDHAYATCLTSWSAWLRTDMWIIMRTVFVVVLGKGQ